MELQFKVGEIYAQDAGDGYKSIRIVVASSVPTEALDMVQVDLRPDGTIYKFCVSGGAWLHSEWPAFRYGDPVPVNSTTDDEIAASEAAAAEAEAEQGYYAECAAREAQSV
jgi:hypothetical protein